MERIEFHEGLVQVYTGAGKGKTSAALGLALRATGYGLRVCVIQFLKGSPTGELKSAEKLAPFLQIEQWGRKSSDPDGRAWVRKGLVREEDRSMAQKALKRAREIILNKEFDILILDEINVALFFGLLELRQVLELIRAKPAEIELILTGQKAPKEILAAADLVTETVKIKHPFDRGMPARKGIEY